MRVTSISPVALSESHFVVVTCLSDAIIVSQCTPPSMFAQIYGMLPSADKITYLVAECRQEHLLSG